MCDFKESGKIFIAACALVCDCMLRRRKGASGERVKEVAPSKLPTVPSLHVSALWMETPWKRRLCH